MRYLLHPARKEALRIAADGGVTRLGLDGADVRVLGEARLPCEDGAVGALAIEGDRVLHAHAGVIDEIDWETCELATRARLPSPIASPDLLSPSGRFLVAMAAPNFFGLPGLIGIVLFDRETTRVDTLGLPSDLPSPLTIDPTSRRMACVFTEQGGGGIATWELERGAAPHVEIERDEDAAYLADAHGRCAFSGGGDILVVHTVTGQGGTFLHLVDARAGVERWVKRLGRAGAGMAVAQPAVSRDGARVACAASDEVLLFDARSGEVTARVPLPVSGAAALHFDTGAQRLWVEAETTLVGLPLP